MVRTIGYLLIIVMCMTASANASTTDNLKKLDSIVATREARNALKREEIERWKAEYARAGTDSDRYNVLRELYKQYRTFRIDSAVIIADNRLKIARTMNDRPKIISATLNLAEGYVKLGMADKAIFMLDTLGKSAMQDYHRKYLNSVYKNAYLLKARTEVLPAEKKKAEEQVRELRDRALAESDSNSRAYYTIQAEKLMDAGLFAKAAAKIEQADSIFDFSNDAAMQYTMGEIYLKAGRRLDAIRCLSKGATIDLESGIKEYQSLILLASLLFEEGDLERAFVYINCALEDARFANANYRNPEIMESLPVIDDAFHAYEKKNNSLTHTFLWIAGVMLATLAVLLIMLLRALKANRKMLATIENFNETLRQRNQYLEDADQLKLDSINTLIMSNARYIARLKQYRKTVYRLMKTGQYDKALEVLRSDRNDSKDIAAFHEMFDESFLSMFPDFIEGVNKIVKSPVELKDNGRLTPELRVMALMRLGLSSTDEIAGVLHYSSQTVYNLRSTIRSMASIPRDEFEEAIRHL